MSVKYNISAHCAGQRAWREVGRETLEFRENPYGDEWNNPPAQAFRRGFDAAARRDGYTYSRLNGDYSRRGEFETDDFPEPSDLREWA